MEQEPEVHDIDPFEDNEPIRVDSLRLRRIFAVSESGLEQEANHDPTELVVLSAIRRSGNVEEGENGGEKLEVNNVPDSRDSSSWPWDKIVERLSAAQEELSIALDIISKVEIATAIGVASVGRSKLQPEESSSNLALEISVKQSMSQRVGNEFLNYHKILQQKVLQDFKFFESLSRFQQHFKLKRFRDPTNPGAPLSFHVDLSLPTPPPAGRIVPLRTFSLPLVPLSPSQTPQEPDSLQGTEECALTAELPRSLLTQINRRLRVRILRQSELAQEDVNHFAALSSTTASPITALHLAQDSALDDMLFADIQRLAFMCPEAPAAMDGGALRWRVGRGEESGLMLQVETAGKSPAKFEPDRDQSEERMQADDAEGSLFAAEAGKGPRHALEIFSRLSFLHSLYGQSGAAQSPAPAGGSLPALLSVVQHRSCARTVETTLQRMALSLPLLSVHYIPSLETESVRGTNKCHWGLSLAVLCLRKSALQGPLDVLSLMSSKLSLSGSSSVSLSLLASPPKDGPLGTNLGTWVGRSQAEWESSSQPVTLSLSQLKAHLLQLSLRLFLEAVLKEAGALGLSAAISFGNFGGYGDQWGAVAVTAGDRCQTAFTVATSITEERLLWTMEKERMGEFPIKPHAYRSAVDGLTWSLFCARLSQMCATLA